MENNQDSNKISRRKFLKFAVLGGAAAVAVSVATPLVGDFLSASWKKIPPTSHAVAQTQSIPIGVPTFIRFEQRVADAWVTSTESQGLWVVTKDGKNFAIFDPHCTHLNCPFYWDEKQGIFVCPCHGGRFDIDGKVLGGPPPRPLDRWEFLVDGGQIEVTGRILKS